MLCKRFFTVHVYPSTNVIEDMWELCKYVTVLSRIIVYRICLSEAYITDRRPLAKFRSLASRRLPHRVIWADKRAFQTPEHLHLSQPAKMDIDTDDEVLQTLANGQTID
jgi:hypothetical protein